MVKKAISQMKAGKAPGPSGIVVEMIRAAGDMCASMVCDLAAAIIRDGRVPSDWEQSFIVSLYKGKRDALERGNYRGLKFSRHGRLIKALEHHTMQPNALPDVQCIMLAMKLTRRSTRILTQSLQNYTALQNSFEKRMPTL